MIPALSLAESLVRSGRLSSDQICFVGSGRGMEEEVLGRSGYRVIKYGGVGLSRGSAIGGMRSVWSNLVASIKILPTLIEVRPSVVVSFGGYYSAMPAVVGRFAGAQVVTVEQNAVMGLANRMCASVSQVVCVPPIFKRGDFRDELVITGNPVRPEVVELVGMPESDRRGLRQKVFVDPGKIGVLAFGGSLGALRLNELIVGAAGRLDDRYFIYHVTGERDLARTEDLYISAGIDRSKYRCVGYDGELFKAMAASDIVVSRAGASTIAELCVLSKASILVPIPDSPYDHQRLNAMALADVGGTLYVDQKELTGAVLADRIVELGSDRERRMRMGEAASGLAVPDATERLGKVVLDLLERQ